MTKEEFNACLERISNGDNGGIEQIYNTYYEKLVFSIRNDITDETIAEDIATSVILSILENAKNYEYVTNPNAWMLTSARYATINYKKKDKRITYVDPDDLAYIAAADDRLDFRIEFYRAVTDLSEKQQRIVELYYMYGYKCKEVAKELGISTSTVKREIAVIKEKLKFLLEF